MDKKDSLSKIYLGAGVLEKWHSKTLDGFEGDPQAKKQVEEYITNIQHNYDNGIGGFLYGTNGTGKTYLLNMVFKYLVDNRVKGARIMSFPTIVGNYTKNWRQEGDWKKIINAPFLGIEEIGKEFSASGVSKELVQAALDALLRYRVQRMRPTWITTNLDPSEILENYGKSLSSLFKECMVLIPVNGDDYRDKLLKDHNPQITTGGGKSKGTPQTTQF
jgi:DNA replication protein DnaC